MHSVSANLAVASAVFNTGSVLPLSSAEIMSLQTARIDILLAVSQLPALRRFFCFDMWVDVIESMLLLAHAYLTARISAEVVQLFSAGSLNAHPLVVSVPSG